MTNFNFDCPYCSRAQTVTEANFSDGKIEFVMQESAIGHLGLKAEAIVCANPDCLRPTVFSAVVKAVPDGYGRLFIAPDAESVLSQQLMPESAAKPQPDFIPSPIREDYTEACRIVRLSPKAAATLARRCLQGMIRDFSGISRSRLIDEIKELNKLIEEDKAPKGVSSDSAEAIDAVRKIGNIGAHMEKDINTIVDVDSGEAQVLIELIESLLDEWYVERETRKNRFSKLSAIAEKTDALKKA